MLGLGVLEEQQGDLSQGRHWYLAYADPALMTPTGQPPIVPDPDKADDGNKGTVLQTVAPMRGGCR
jgi:hypothetical protein